MDLGAILRQQLSYQLEKTSGWKIHSGTIKSGLLPGSFSISDIILSKHTTEESISFTAHEVKLNALSLKSLTQDKELRFSSVSFEDPRIKGKAKVSQSSGKISLPVKTEKMNVSNGKIDIQLQMKNGTMVEIDGEGDFTLNNLDLKNVEVKDLPSIVKRGKGKNVNVKFKDSQIQIKEVIAEDGKISGTGVSMNVISASSGTKIFGNVNSIIAEVKKNTGKVSIEGGNLEFDLDKTKTTKGKSNIPDLYGIIEIRNSKLKVNDIQKTGIVNHSVNLDHIKAEKKGKNLDLIDAIITNYEGKKKSQILRINQVVAEGAESKVKVDGLSFSQKKIKDIPGVEVEIPALTSQNVTIGSLLRKEVKAGSIVLHNPSFNFNTLQGDGATKSINNLLNQFFTDQGATGTVNNCIIENGNLALITTGNSDTLWHKVNEFTLTTKNLNLGRKYPVPAKGFELTAPSLMVASKDGNFHIEGKDLHIDGNAGKISGNGIKVRQHHSKGKEQPFFFDASADFFNSTTSHIQKLLDKNELNLKDLQINSPIVNIELDEKKLPKSCSNAPLLPKHVLEIIPFPVNIENMKFQKGKISFKDIVPDFQKPGILNLTHADISATNVSNFINRDSKVNLQAIMEDAPLNVEISMPLLSPKMTLKYHGNYGKTEMSRFNDWLYFDGIGAEKGMLNGVSFNVEMKDGKANGEIQMLYEDLKLTVYNQKKQKKSKVKSFLSRFVTHKENMPKKKKQPETIQVATEWKPEFSFMYFLWHPVKEGMMQTVTKDAYAKMQ